MTEYLGYAFAINGVKQPAPDEDVWTESVYGVSLGGLTKKSPYETLEWRKQVANQEDVASWFEFENTVLTSITTRPDPSVNRYETYTDAICLSVTKRGTRNAATEIVATFTVRRSSAT